MENYENPWLYQGVFFNLELVKDYIGFVYEIKNIHTGERYIGKKFFTKAGYKQVRGKRKKLRKESDWKTYYSSGPRMLEAVKMYSKTNFRRKILRLCKTKSECSYYESKFIFERDALLTNNYLNDWILCRITRKHLKHLQID